MVESLSSATYRTTGEQGISVGHTTVSSRDQLDTETAVVNCFRRFLLSGTSGDSDDIILDRERHTAWLKKALVSLPVNFCGLDASRPWFVYWVSHALELLGEYDQDFWAPKAGAFLNACQNETGGFGGGPMQLSHLAPTYAAVSALMVGGREVSWRAADRERIYRFLMHMKVPTGGFMMHDEGETDMRGTYCALVVASMLHILTDELIEGIPEYVCRCQTFEGGIAGEDGLEAHGGYAYCGLSALCIIGRADAIDLHAMLHWATHRQMQMEGGFQGRTNKLVDSCYCFWMGAIFPLLWEAFRQQGDRTAVPLPSSHQWFQPAPLQTYVLLACQNPNGGVVDKPGKRPDYYHSCYSLSGTASLQYNSNGEPSCVVGDPTNKMERNDVFYNVAFEKTVAAREFFSNLPPFSVTAADGRAMVGREGQGAIAYRQYVLSKDSPG